MIHLHLFTGKIGKSKRVIRQPNWLVASSKDRIQIKHEGRTTPHFTLSHFSYFLSYLSSSTLPSSSLYLWLVPLLHISVRTVCVMFSWDAFSRLQLTAVSDFPSLSFLRCLSQVCLCLPACTTLASLTLRRMLLNWVLCLLKQNTWFSCSRVKKHTMLWQWALGWFACCCRNTAVHTVVWVWMWVLWLRDSGLHSNE